MHCLAHGSASIGRVRWPSLCTALLVCCMSLQGPLGFHFPLAFPVQHIVFCKCVQHSSVWLAFWPGNSLRFPVPVNSCVWILISSQQHFWQWGWIWNSSVLIPFSLPFHSSEGSFHCLTVNRTLPHACSMMQLLDFLFCFLNVRFPVSSLKGNLWFLLVFQFINSKEAP